MSLTDNGAGNGMVMPVSPMNGGYGNGFGWGGDGSFWIIILFLFAFMGNGWGGFGGNASAPMILNNTANDVQRGFDQQAVMNGLSTIQNNTTSGMNALAMSLQNCCCENRAATADLKYTVANDGALTRSQLQAGIQTVIDKLCQQEIDALKEQNANLRTQLNMASLAASQNQQTSDIIRGINPVPIPAYMVQNPNGCGCNNGLVA